jgi:hypothetical protein
VPIQVLTILPSFALGSLPRAGCGRARTDTSAVVIRLFGAEHRPSNSCGLAAGTSHRDIRSPSREYGAGQAGAWRADQQPHHWIGLGGSNKLYFGAVMMLS